MKKYILILICVALPAISIAQPAAVRKAFRKYGHHEGIVKITIPGCVMGFAALFIDDKEAAKMLRNVDKIKILATEDDTDGSHFNFASEILDNFKSRSFEELLTVRDNDDDVAILMKEGRRNKKELLIIAGGKTESAIVYIKGKVSPEMLSSIGKEMKIDALKSL